MTRYKDPTTNKERRGVINNLTIPAILDGDDTDVDENDSEVVLLPSAICSGSYSEINRRSKSIPC